jgi:ubiquinone biosynthesis monooxygenase Coq7
LPGDRDAEAELEAMLRVDQAGEFGAVQIYAGQLAVLGETRSRAIVEEMAAAEAEHLETFDALLVERGVRPTALTPLWRAAGFLLGAGTALLSQRHAMLCTAAVEAEIERHYRRQEARLGDDEKNLRETIETFRADEARHRETALEHEAEQALGHRPLGAAIRAGTRLAIWLSTRV